MLVNYRIVLNYIEQSHELCSSAKELTLVVMEKKGVSYMIVNNIGTINENNKIWEVPKEEFDTVINTSVKRTTNVMWQSIALMI